MVFSSVPLYLDPHNWHVQQQAQLHHHQQRQQQNQQLSHGGGDNTHPNHQIGVQMPPPPPTASQTAGGGVGSSSIRPGSMADRARQAKIPQPEPGLKCPRCESTNTKFCYFNNYSLSQPRHFCKTCRRYWTRGGALRNVPVGGGCRRNKRTGNKTTGASGSKPVNGEQDSNLNNNNNNGSISPVISSTMLEDNSSLHQPRLAQIPLLASLQGLAGHYGSPPSSLGLSFSSMMSAAAAQDELGFQIGGNSNSNNSNGSGSDHQWRPHHFPNFLAGFDPPQQIPHSSLFQFPVDHSHQSTHPPLRSSVSQQPARPPDNPATDHHQQQSDEAGAKAEAAAAGQQGGMNTNLVSRSFLGTSDHSNNNQYWNNSTWTDMSGLNSSTTSLL